MKNFVKSRYAIALFLFLIFGGKTIAMGLNNSTENLFNAQNSPATNFNMMTPEEFLIFRRFYRSPESSNNYGRSLNYCKWIREIGV